MIEKLDRIVAPNDNLGYLTGRTLEDVSSMSRSLRSLADYLDRHPEAVIRGKGAGGKGQ
jgi:paraquat-inducible protein B